jgi:hypothetical protein
MIIFSLMRQKVERQTRVKNMVSRFFEASDD